MKASATPKQKRHWAQINEASFVLGMRLLFWICRIFGRGPFRIVLYPVVAWYVLTQPAARAASADYLRRINAMGGAPRAKPGMPDVMRHFAAFAESILDKMLLWGGLFDLENTRYHGRELLDQLVGEQRGALLVCSHLGNMELCRVLSRRRTGLKLTVLVHTKHATAFNDMLAQLDPDSRMNLLQVTEMSAATAAMLAEKVAQGEFVVIAGDRIPVSGNPRVALAKFMGEPAPFPVGPYVLASLLECPIFLMFALCTANGPEVHVELFRESLRLPRKGRDEVLAALTAEYAGRLEHYCLRAPLQWFNFYDFWHLPGSD
jgi:predicted LPLAT superfamily acyltransferase